MMMDRRYTIIIVPHTSANPRKIQVSAKFLSYVFIGLVSFLVASAGTMIHYFQYFQQVTNLKKAEEENVQLRANLQQSAVLTQKLNRKISFLTELSNKLRIMAGLPNAKRPQQELPPLKPGIGGFTMTPTATNTFDPQRLLVLEKRTDYLEKTFVSLNNYFEKQNQELSTTPSILPAEGFISSSFGSRLNPFTNAPDYHEGVDLTNEVGTPVIAPADGVVTFTGLKGNYGQVIEIRHDDEVSTLYGHLDKILVKQGQKVTRWQQIGLMGNSGRSTGPHLHYEVHINDQPVNPMPYILNLASTEG